METILNNGWANHFCCQSITVFFFFKHRLLNTVGIPKQSMQVKIQSTYLTLRVVFFLYGPFLSHHKGIHTPTSESCREIMEKRQLEDNRR